MKKKAASKEVTRVLYVTGDDYAAMTAEDDIGIDELVKMVEQDEELPDGIDAEIMSFNGKIDPNFIDFLFNKMIDYDRSKHSSFFIIPDAEAK